MRENGRGGQLAISAGNPTAVPTPDAWAASTAYKLDQVVTVGSGADATQALCILAHTAGASGLTASSGVLSGDDAPNWMAIEDGTLVALTNWTYDTSEQTTPETLVIEDQDRVVGTTTTTTGQIVVQDDDEDGFDEAQRALVVSNQFTMKLYPKGIGSGKSVFTGTARITGESGGFSTDTLARTFAFAIQGNWTRTLQA